MRFISVDGGHTREVCCNDLQLSERLLIPGGIVALDDIYRLDWSGVTAGLHRYYARGGHLIPFALVPNKVLFTSGRHYAREYKAFLKNSFASSLDQVPTQQSQQFFEFDGVTLYRDQRFPYYPFAGLAIDHR